MYVLSNYSISHFILQYIIACKIACIFTPLFELKFNWRDSKMFEINNEKNLNKTIRMPEGLINRLETIAAKKDISFNKLVVQCCEYALNDLKDEDK